MSRTRRCFVGAVLSKLTLLEMVGHRSIGSQNKQVEVWRCKCECGNIVEYLASSLCCRAKSCGCLNKKHLLEMQHNRIKHPIGSEKEQNTLNMMMNRCYNKKLPCYKYYGGRGITVCDRWNPKKTKDAYVNFIADMGMRPEGMRVIDRIDNDQGYYPGNCRWTTYLVSANNTRRTKRS